MLCESNLLSRNKFEIVFLILDRLCVAKNKVSIQIYKKKHIKIKIPATRVFL